ncbi:hypothetical protein Bca4012_037693 [Brassica carinata]|uniref:Uncharacterized protein n=1 Tax=Brassica carinata TaxID=52824 RepID=A0A8X7WHW8_BRACI|nr:hypothetical protein Bca52824_011346 [Brassica carinata]
MTAYPIFYGDDVKLWISMMERLFHGNILWNSEKLEFKIYGRRSRRFCSFETIELEDLGTKSDAENSLHAEETDTKEDEDTDAVAACETMLIAPVLDSVSTESELLFQTPEVIDEVIQQSQVPISFLVSRPGDMMSGVYGMDVVVENQNLEIKAVEKKLFDDFHENFCFGYLCKGAE